MLEIGTGSGYQTAVLLEIGAIVYSIERQNKLFKKAESFFKKQKKAPKKLIFGDGYIGLQTEAPFDGIVVTAGCSLCTKAITISIKNRREVGDSCWRSLSNNDGLYKNIQNSL